MFNNSVEFHNFTLLLKSLKVSYLTKIRKPKRKRGRELIVMLVAAQ